MISLMITGASIALQALDQLLAAHQHRPNAGAGAPFSTGQSLPGGAATTASAGPPATPAGQFSPATLAALTAAQEFVGR